MAVGKTWVEVGQEVVDLTKPLLALNMDWFIGRAEAESSKFKTKEEKDVYDAFLRTARAVRHLQSVVVDAFGVTMKEAPEEAS